jgi:hypothetical protein
LKEQKYGKFVLLVIAVLVLSSGTLMVNAQEGETAAGNGVAVTVYNQGTALIRDRRTFDLNEGVNVVNFTDVASSIDSTSVVFTSLTDPQGTIVLEQNYVYDLVNSEALLQRYLDERIEVTAEDGTVYAGQLLSGRGGEIILRTDGGEVVVLHAATAATSSSPNAGGSHARLLRWLINSSLRSAAVGHLPDPAAFRGQRTITSCSPQITPRSPQRLGDAQQHQQRCPTRSSSWWLAMSTACRARHKGYYERIWR